MSPDYKVISLGKEYREEFINIILTAFQHDPLFNRIMKGIKCSKKKEKKLRAFVSFIIDKALLFKDCVVGIQSEGRLAAVEIVEAEPTYTFSFFIRSLRSLLLYIPLLFALPLSSVFLLLSFLTKRKELLPGEPMHYLEILAVHPDFRGKGFARILVDYAINLAHCDPRSRGIGLETMNSLNKDFYKHLGFDSVMNIVVQDLPVYFFLCKSS